LHIHTPTNGAQTCPMVTARIGPLQQLDKRLVIKFLENSSLKALWVMFGGRCGDLGHKLVAKCIKIVALCIVIFALCTA